MLFFGNNIICGGKNRFFFINITCFFIENVDLLKTFLFYVKKRGIKSRKKTLFAKVLF